MSRENVVSSGCFSRGTGRAEGTLRRRVGVRCGERPECIGAKRDGSVIPGWRCQGGKGQRNRALQGVGERRQKRWDAVRGRGNTDKFHHGQRTHGNDQIIVLTRLQQALQRIGYQRFFAKAAVISDNCEMVGDDGKLLLQKHQLPVPEAQNTVNVTSGKVQCLCQRVGYGAAQPPAVTTALRMPSNGAGCPSGPVRS